MVHEAVEASLLVPTKHDTSLFPYSISTQVDLERNWRHTGLYLRLGLCCVEGYLRLAAVFKGTGVGGGGEY